MKTSAFICLLSGSLFIFSCGGNDTATKMPEGGYQQRADSATTNDTVKVVKDKNAVAVDTIKNGQAVISGATSDSSK